MEIATGPDLVSWCFAWFLSSLSARPSRRIHDGSQHLPAERPRTFGIRIGKVSAKQPDAHRLAPTTLCDQLEVCVLDDPNRGGVAATNHIPKSASRPALHRNDLMQRKAREPFAAMRRMRPGVPNLEVLIAKKWKSPVTWSVARIVHEATRLIDANGADFAIRKKMRAPKEPSEGEAQLHLKVGAVGPRIGWTGPPDLEEIAGRKAMQMLNGVFA